MKKPALALLLFAAAVAVAPGCTSVSRGIGKITSNKYASARSGTVWIVPPPQLEPPAPENKTCYVSWRNISDSNLDMSQALKDAAIGQGWQVVNDPTTAHYRLRAQCRFFGEVNPESGGADVGSQMGWIAGAAVGVGTYAMVSNATDNWAAGAVAGGVAGGLVGSGLSNASKPREWAMIIDFVLEERTEEEVEFEVLASSDNSGSGGGGVSGARMGESGSSSTGSSTSGGMTRRSNYFPHGVRLSAWANQMNMGEDEALPLVQERAAKVVTQMLPQ